MASHAGSPPDVTVERTMGGLPARLERWWKMASPVVVCVFVVLTLSIYAELAKMHGKMSKIQTDLVRVQNETRACACATLASTESPASASSVDVLREIMELYDKVTEENTQIFYPGVNLNLTLPQAIFDDGAFGGLSRGSRMHPAIVARGPIYAEGPLVVNGETADVFLWSSGSGEFVSVAERLGLGTVRSVPESDNLQPEADPVAWTSKLCRGSVVGKACPERHNWGVDSCTLDYDNTTTICYCGGGYRTDITGVVHRHFLCKAGREACLLQFSNEAPACCSPTSAAAGCARSEGIESVCTNSADGDLCCDGLPQATCLLYGCTWSTNTCTYTPVPGPESYYIDLYSKCEKWERHSVCNMQARTRYLAIYADFTACAAATSPEQCLLNYRISVQNEVWGNNTLTDMYNWFDAHHYHIRLPSSTWRDCAKPYISVSPVQGPLRNAYPASWVCDPRSAQKLVFYPAPWQRDYTQEQGRVAFVLTKPHSEGDWFCLSAPLTKQLNITYHAQATPSSHPLWVSTGDAQEWDMCARITMPLSLGELFQFTHESSFPLGFDFASRGTRYANTYTIVVDAA